MGLFDKIIGTYSEREVKRLMPIVEKINSLEQEMSELTDKQLADKTEYFKERVQQDGESLDDVLPEAFAVVREASKRVLGMRHFDVQLIGGIILHQGRIAEMKTGEGKTLVATLPVYLNALTGKGVHVVTVNEYLAKRDSEWMGKVYKFLGLTVGLNLSFMSPSEKQKAYNCDVTYGTNSEFGFDYLRDNMVIQKRDMVQRDLHFAIVDEVDSILIDEARTPLIISGRSSKSSDLYKKADTFVKRLRKKEVVEEDIKDQEQLDDNEKYDYLVDLKAQSATLTQQGIDKAEQYFNLENYDDIENSDIIHAIDQALHANGVKKRDVDYIVKDGEVLIVDENTGRIMYGRRYSNGLHQAIEAKENVKIAEESKTLATITYQNFFRMYAKLSGMTGTAMTEEAEFKQIYNLDVIEIPTNKPVIRIDHNDVIYKNESAKFNAIVEEIKRTHETGQPVLVGTVSIDKSEKLSSLLSKTGLKHEVLNAKNHEKEAEIIAQAGKYGAITIATNMAGRGTDIMLGGNSEYLAKQEMRKNGLTETLIEQADSHNETDDEEVLNARKTFKELKAKYDDEIKEEKQKVIDAGGLKIIGTERHETRRIDNQLRGRSGRQGDPGESVFYLGLDDNLLKLFGGNMITNLLNTGNVPDDMPLPPMKPLSIAIENAQQKIEGRNFSIRKHILSYDDVMNVQREEIYKERRMVIDGEDVHDNIVGMIEDSADMVVDTYLPEIEDGTVNKDSLRAEIINIFNTPDFDALNQEKINPNLLKEEIKMKSVESFNKKLEENGEEFKEVERILLLKSVDDRWMDHIDEMDSLKNGIGLRAYGQKDPVVQYRMEGGQMFEEMVNQIKLDVTKYCMRVGKVQNMERKSSVSIESSGLDRSAIDNMNIEGEASQNIEQARQVSQSKQQPVVNNGPKVGRNDPCPCGSGKKYKNCCGRNA